MNFNDVLPIDFTALDLINTDCNVLADNAANIVFIKEYLAKYWVDVDFALYVDFEDTSDTSKHIYISDFFSDFRFPIHPSTQTATLDALLRKFVKTINNYK